MSSSAARPAQTGSPPTSSSTHCGAHMHMATSGPLSVGTSTLVPTAGEYGPGAGEYRRPYCSKLTAIILPTAPEYVPGAPESGGGEGERHLFPRHHRRAAAVPPRPP